MANTVTNVSQAKPKVTGAINVALVSSVESLPGSTSATLDSSIYKCLGYLTDEGVTNNDTVNKETVKAWGGDVVLTTEDGKDDTFAFTMMESKNADALKFIYGASNVTVADGEIHVNSKTIGPDEYVVVIDMVLRGNVAKRIVIPDGQLQELGEIAYVGNDAIKYPVTINAMADSTGTTHHEYIAIGE